MSTNDLTQLMNSSVELATACLQDEEPFLGFALVIDQEGEMTQLRCEVGVSDTEELKTLFLASLRDGARNNLYRCVALLLTVRIEDPGKEAQSEGLWIHMEDHEDGPVTLLLPYGLEANEISFGDLQELDTESLIFEHDVALN